MSDPGAAAPATPGNFQDFLASADAASDAGDSGDAAPGGGGDASGEGFAESPARRTARGDVERDAREAPDNPADHDEPAEESGEFEDEGLGEEQPEGEEGEEPTEEEQQNGAPTKAQLMEMFEAISSPQLPEQLMDRMLRVSDGEREYDVSIHEMRQGYMRARNFSRSKAELARVTKEARGLVDGVRESFTRWRQSPETMVSAIPEIIGQEAFDKAVIMRAVQLHQLRQMPEEQRQMFLELEQARAQARQAQLEAQRAAQANQPDPQQQQAAVGHFVQNVVPQVFQRHGITLSEPALNAFTRNFQPIWNGREETVYAAMEEAAVATAQELRDNAREYWEQHQQMLAQQRPRQRQPQRPAQLSPRALPGPSAKAGATRGTRKGGGSPSDFARLRERSNGR